MARVDIFGIGSPNFRPGVNNAAPVEKASKELIFAVGIEENVSKAGSRVMVVVAAAEPTFSISLIDSSSEITRFWEYNLETGIGTVLDHSRH